MLRHNTSLISLDLACNQVGPEGAGRFAAVLSGKRGNSTLTMLGFVFCCVEERRGEGGVERRGEERRGEERREKRY
jgi:hypothetical protein